MSFSVLFVCTGNICRSPVAEKLFRDRMAPDADVVVSSAGTSGLTGWGIDRPSAVALRELGVDPDGHYARRVDAAILRACDLVLAASDEHRGMMLRAEPSMISKTFTLREFGRLAHDAPHTPTPIATDADHLRACVKVIAGRRGVAAAPAAGADDIGDPYGASLDVARATVAEIAAAVDVALIALSLN